MRSYQLHIRNRPRSSSLVITIAMAVALLMNALTSSTQRTYVSHLLLNSREASVCNSPRRLLCKTSTVSMRYAIEIIAKTKQKTFPHAVICVKASSPINQKTNSAIQLYAWINQGRAGGVTGMTLLNRGVTVVRKSRLSLADNHATSL